MSPMTVAGRRRAKTSGGRNKEVAGPLPFTVRPVSESPEDIHRTLLLQVRIGRPLTL